MKKLFSNTVFAVALTVVLVLLSIILNTRIGLGKKCNYVTDQFYSPTNGETSIASELRSLCNASENLILLAVKNGQESPEAATAEIAEIRELLNDECRKAGRIYPVYEQLLKETFRLESDLSRMDLSEEDAEALAEATTQAYNAKTAIDASSYNDSARAFLKHYRRFPAPLFAALSGVTMPQLFA